MDDFLLEEQWNKLFSSDGLLFLPNCPPGLEIGLDTLSHDTGKDFKGVSHLPPGLHFFSYNYPNLPRYGFFLWVNSESEGQSPESVFLYPWNEKEEEFFEYQESNKPDVLKNVKMDVLRGTLHTNLVRYSNQQNNLWMNLVQFISVDNFNLLNIKSKLLIHPEYQEEMEENKEKTEELVTLLSSHYNILIKNDEELGKNEMEIDEEEYEKFFNFSSSSFSPSLISSSSFNRPHYINHNQLIHTNQKLFHQFHNSDKSKKKLKNFSTILTLFSLDYSWLLNFLIKSYYNNQLQNLLGEIQLSYLLFFFAYNISSLNYWKKMIYYVCNSEFFLFKNPNFLNSFLLLFYNELKFVTIELFEENFFSWGNEEKSKESHTEDRERENKSSNFFLTVLESLFNILNHIEITYKDLKISYELSKEQSLKSKQELQGISEQLDLYESIIINKKKFEKYLNKKFNIVFRKNVNTVDETFFHSNIQKYRDELVKEEELIQENFSYTLKRSPASSTSFSNGKKTTNVEDIECTIEAKDEDFNMNEKMYEILLNPKTLVINTSREDELEVKEKLSQVQVDSSNIEYMKYSWRYPLLSQENERYKTQEDFIMTAMRIYDEYNEKLMTKSSESLSEEEKIYNEALHFINNEVSF